MVSSAQNASSSGSVDPPTPQEISRKLSVHNRPVKSQPIAAHAVSGTESDSDSFSPDYSPLTGAHVAGGSHPHPIVHPHGHGHSHSMSLGLSTSASSKPLSSIAERAVGSGDEESDEDDEPEGDEEWAHERDQPYVTRGAGPDGDSIIKSGYLLKKGERRKTWKKRWFVLRPAQIAVYKSSAEYKLLRLLDLSDVHSCSPVALKRHANSFVLVYPTRTYYLQAQSGQDMQEWVRSLNQAREVLMGTSTQNSIVSPVPIPIPISPGGSRHPNALSYSPTAGLGAGAVTPSPPSARSVGFAGPVTSESDSEDQNAGEIAVPTDAAPSRVRTSGALSMDPSKVVYSGYLMKCRSKRRGWRKRWFMLTGEKLIYSASHMDAKRQRSIDLSQVIDALEYDISHSTASPPTLGGDDHTHIHAHAHSHESDPANGMLGASSGGAQYTFKIVTTKRTLLLCAPSEAEEIKWLSTVRALIARRSSPPGAGSPIAVPGAPGSTMQALEGAMPGAGVKASTSAGSRKRSASGASNLVLAREEHQHH
ncbi:hypothetical protein M0805_007867 [Coniferiporia weirii]|nr:hypothetical protein M0805_007867 [Coniferiporia weirii]